MRYIDILKDHLPYTAEVPLKSKYNIGDGTLLYTLEFQHNTRHDFITLGIKYNDTDIISGEKLVINQPINIRHEYAPAVALVPRNRPGQRGEVNFKNLGDTVLLAVEGDDDDEL